MTSTKSIIVSNRGQGDITKREDFTPMKLLLCNNLDYIFVPFWSWYIPVEIYDTGSPVYVDTEIIGLIISLPAQGCEQELRERTRIDHKFSSMIYLVRENADEILKLAKIKV